MTEVRSGSATAPILSVRDVSISFGEQRVLKSVSMDLRTRRVTGLVGENGSGKSTLVKILAGYHKAESGSLIVNDEDLLRGHYDAGRSQRAGMRFVHQDLKLVEKLDAVENVALMAGYLTGPGKRIRWRATRAAVLSWFTERFGRPPDLHSEVSGLSAIDRVHVAIARALFTLPGAPSPRVLVLDEVTSGLPRSEINEVAGLIAGVQEAGVSVLFISHDLDDVLRIVDDVTVLREGAVVGRLEARSCGAAELASLVLGRPPEKREARQRAKRTIGQPVLSLRGVCTGPLKSVDFAVQSGETVGVTGGITCGKSALGRVLYGAQRPRLGEILLDGKPARNFDIPTAIKSGVGYLPQRHAAIPSLTVRENLDIVSLGDFAHRGWISLRHERARAERSLSVADVRPPDPERLIDVLSGGNRQKTLLARWTNRPLRVLIVDEVTANVDVGATEAIHSLLRQKVDSGLGLVVISSDYRELEQLCDSVMILNYGRVIDVLRGADVSQHGIADRILTASSTQKGAGARV